MKKRQAKKNAKKIQETEYQKRIHVSASKWTSLKLEGKKGSAYAKT